MCVVSFMFILFNLINFESLFNRLCDDQRLCGLYVVYCKLICLFYSLNIEL